MKTICSLIVALIAGGCAGFSGFKDDAAFQRYVDGLNLRNTPVDSAASKLSVEHFKCERSTLPNSREGDVDCLRGVGTQSLMVRLSPDPDNPNTTRVVTSRTIVVW